MEALHHQIKYIFLVLQERIIPEVETKTYYTKQGLWLRYIQRCTHTITVSPKRSSSLILSLRLSKQSFIEIPYFAAHALCINSYTLTHLANVVIPSEAANENKVLREAPGRRIILIFHRICPFQEPFYTTWH